MRKKQAWLEHGKHRTNSCEPMSDKTMARKLRQAFARKTEHKHTVDEFGTVSLVAPTEAQLSKAGIRL